MSDTTTIDLAAGYEPTDDELALLAEEDADA
jgi:hypothetical protein